MGKLNYLKPHGYKVAGWDLTLSEWFGSRICSLKLNGCTAGWGWASADLGTVEVMFFECVKKLMKISGAPKASITLKV